MYLEAPADPNLPPMPIAGYGGPLLGVYTALVTDVQDPDGQGRVRVRLPWASDPDGQLYETWARLATPMAGAGRGVWLIPEPDDEVIVGFVGGDRSQPIVLGATWNGRDAPPETMDAGNNIRSITSRSGIRLTFDDTDGAVSVTVETPGGQVITCTDSPATIELRDSGGNIVKLESSGVSITTSGRLSVQASTVEFSASSVTMNCGTMSVSGPLNANSCLNTPSVIGASYTPGAGNIW